MGSKGRVVNNHEIIVTMYTQPLFFILFQKEKEKDVDEDKSKIKSTRAPTSYTLFCKAHRTHILTENPGIGKALLVPLITSMLV